jgi:hypothetical protein
MQYSYTTYFGSNKAIIREINVRKLECNRKIILERVFLCIRYSGIKYSFCCFSTLVCVFLYVCNIGNQKLEVKSMQYLDKLVQYK